MKAIGKFQILEDLGGGATGQTYRTHDRFRKREFAVKVLRNIPNLGAEVKDRFCEYMTCCAQLTHRQIARVDDLGEIDEGIFVATDWLSGMNLREFMRAEQDLPLERKLALIAQVAEGLAFAHSRGVVHGNLKPSDIFVDDSYDVSILDFGAAQWLQALIQSGVRPEQMAIKYLSPEQILDQPTDSRADIFSLGLILYEFATGRYPFSADPGVLPREIVHSEPEPLRQWDAQIPEALEQLVAQTLKKDPGQRVQSADELASGLYLAARKVRRLNGAEPSPSPLESTNPTLLANITSPSVQLPPALTQQPVVPPRQVQAAVPMDLASTAVQGAAAQVPVRKRPQEAEAEPQPWTPRSYVYANSASAPASPTSPTSPTSKEAPPVRPVSPPASADAEEQLLTEQPPPPALPAAASIPHVLQERVPMPAPSSPRQIAQPPPFRKGKLTKGVLTTVIGLVLAIVIVSSLMPRQNLRASQNKNRVVIKETESVPPIVKPKPVATTGATSSPKPAQPQPSNDPQLVAKRTLSSARWQWENGRYAKALALVEQVLATDPTNEEARTWKKKIVDAQAAEAALK